MKSHQLLNQRYQNFKELETKIESLETTTEKGEVFEQFVYSYLFLKKDLFQVSKVFREKDIPPNIREKYKLENRDSGVDGLMILRNGKSAAYQVKFRTNRAVPSYAELAKFWIEGAHTDYNYTIANSYYLTRLAQKQEKHIGILADEFDQLDIEFFKQLQEFHSEKKISPKIWFKPYEFQQAMINDVVKGFINHDRGKLIAACGTGKTLAALWISEGIGAEKLLFVAPSLALIKQTLEQWSDQTKRDFEYLCICSDRSVADDIEDSGDISVQDFIVPVTTDITHIKDFLSVDSSKTKIIFSTYQSLDILSKAQYQTPSHSFDLIVFDEAHRTAGAKNSKLFSLGLENESIRSKKRLFMTATEKLIRPWIIKKAEDLNRVVFSMDDEKLYGPVFHRFNFGDAIQKKVISDYRVVVAGITESQVYAWIKENRILTDSLDDDLEFQESAQNIFRQLILIRAIKELGISKIITFHNSIRNAKNFSNGTSSHSIDLLMVKDQIIPEVDSEDFYSDHINGSMPTSERKQKLQKFKTTNLGVITNSMCLTEGVDVPEIDCVYFVEPRSSLIGIVQACGRALRKPRNGKEKIAYFLIPILIPEGLSHAEILNQVDFEMVYSIIQALRDQDQRLAQWIDKINLGAIRGRTRKVSEENSNPIILDLPQEFDISKFNESLFLQIAEVNGDPTKVFALAKSYGKKERTSKYKRKFRTLGDYSYQSYCDQLVDPTIVLFDNLESHKSSGELKINHNNISHTGRLGLIEKDKNNNFYLTPLGKYYFSKEITFSDLFLRQMLKYYVFSNKDDVNSILFPYRACLKILLEVKLLSYYEFVFGLFNIKDSKSHSIQKAVFSINHLRKAFPNIGIVNKANRKPLLDELNNLFETNYSETDVWEKKTTVNNQHIYFRNHMALFSSAIEIEKSTQTIFLSESRENEISDYLKQDSAIETLSSTKQLREFYIKIK